MSPLAKMVYDFCCSEIRNYRLAEDLSDAVDRDNGEAPLRQLHRFCGEVFGFGSHQERQVKQFLMLL